jgi:hypothetical protein
MLVELVRESKVELGAEGTFVLAKRLLPAGHPPGQRGVFGLFRMDKIDLERPLPDAKGMEAMGDEVVKSRIQTKFR